MLRRNDWAKVSRRFKSWLNWLWQAVVNLLALSVAHKVKSLCISVGILADQVRWVLFEIIQVWQESLLATRMRQALHRVFPLVLLSLAGRLANRPVTFLKNARFMTWNAHLANMSGMSWRSAISCLGNQLALAGLAPNYVYNGYRGVFSGLELWVLSLVRCCHGLGIDLLEGIRDRQVTLLLELDHRFIRLIARFRWHRNLVFTVWSHHTLAFATENSLNYLVCRDASSRGLPLRHFNKIRRILVLVAKSVFDTCNGNLWSLGPDSLVAWTVSSERGTV